MPRSDLLDVRLESTPVDPGRLGVVLFDLPGEQFAGLVADLRRLTRQPLQFHWLPTGEDETGRVLVRVHSPPAIVVWRAMDQGEADSPLSPASGERGGGEGVTRRAERREPPDVDLIGPLTGLPLAQDPLTPALSPEAGERERKPLRAAVYTESAPGVWVEFGFRLRDARVRPPGNHILLIRRSGAEAVPAREFAEEIETIPLAPALRADVRGSAAPSISTRLRLVRGEEREAPRLWVLREDALAQLTTYCRATHEQLLARFTVAVSASAGVPCVVLRAGTAKGPPPVFVGAAVAYAPAFKLPTLFLPAAARLAPPLRRDALRPALALQSDRVVWLHPLGDGGFRAESLPESAFQPLPDWVEYRLPAAARPVTAWVQSYRWELEPFLERPEPKPKPPDPVAPVTPRLVPKQPKPGVLSRTFGWLKNSFRPPKGLKLPPPPTSEPAGVAVSVEDVEKEIVNPADRLHLARPETNNSALERCHTLEGQFLKNLAAMAPGGEPEHWAELAAAYDAAGNHADAAICWLNALWGVPKPGAQWAWSWLRSEGRAARQEVKSIDPGPWLAGAPGPGTTRAMAAWVVWASVQTPTPPALAERAADLQARLEAHEHWLPVRAVWLARTATARLGSDVLGLARTRDRVSERLLVNGLSLELDTPSFLRFAGEGVRERFQEARRWLIDKRDLIHQWIARLPGEGRARTSPESEAILRDKGLEPDTAHTRAYADLILSWGLTRFAENNAADNVRKQAVAALPADIAVQAILRGGFEYRIGQVREGKPPRGPLPANLLARIEALESTPRYAVDKLREFSRVLEPTVRVDGYGATVYRKAANLTASPAAAIGTLSPDRLNDEVAGLLRAELDRDGRPHLAEVAGAVLDRAFELSADGAEAVVAALPDALVASRDAHRPLARLIGKGLDAAALWDRPELARDLSARFLQMADGRAGWDAAEELTRKAFRALRRLGLKADADRVLHLVAERILQGQPIAKRRVSLGAEWPTALRVLLHAAAGWYYAGRDEHAHAVLDEARKDLYAPETPTGHRTKLAVTYATTLGQAPARVALGRLEEMFQRLTGIAAGGSTNAYYSLKPLDLIETAVRAIVSDDFALGPEVRAWLDADEFTVRRRVRDELKAVMASQDL